MAANIVGFCGSKVLADGAIAIETLTSGADSAAILQVVIRVHSGDLFVGGVGDLTVTTGVRLTNQDGPLVLDFTAANPANGELAVLAGGTVPTVFSVYTYGA